MWKNDSTTRSMPLKICSYRTVRKEVTRSVTMGKNAGSIHIDDNLNVHFFASSSENTQMTFYSMNGQ
jgi:hypothetical protein